MEALVNIEYWCASPLGTFIQMYNVEKAPYVLPKFSMDKLVMQEVAYHTLTGLSTRLYRKKKAHWPTLPLWIGCYEIQSLKNTEAEMEEFNRFTFNTRSFNPYDPHYVAKDHCMRVYHPWIHSTCHWPKEDPWRYRYNSSRLNEPDKVDVE